MSEETKVYPGEVLMDCLLDIQDGKHVARCIVKKTDGTLREFISPMNENGTFTVDVTKEQINVSET